MACPMAVRDAGACCPDGGGFFIKVTEGLFGDCFKDGVSGRDAEGCECTVCIVGIAVVW